MVSYTTVALSSFYTYLYIHNTLDILIMIPTEILGFSRIHMIQLKIHVAFMKKLPTEQLSYNAFWYIAEGNYELKCAYIMHIAV